MDIAARLALDRIDPPLQADLAGRGIGHEIAHARHLDGEGRERMQVRALVGRREKAGEPAVAVGLAHERVAMRVMRARDASRDRPRCRRDHAVAIKAAATRRVRRAGCCRCARRRASPSVPRRSSCAAGRARRPDRASANPSPVPISRCSIASASANTCGERGDVDLGRRSRRPRDDAGRQRAGSSRDGPCRRNGNRPRRRPSIGCGRRRRSLRAAFVTRLIAYATAWRAFASVPSSARAARGSRCAGRDRSASASR